MGKIGRSSEIFLAFAISDGSGLQGRMIRSSRRKPVDATYGEENNIKHPSIAPSPSDPFAIKPARR